MSDPQQAGGVAAKGKLNGWGCMIFMALAVVGLVLSCGQLVLGIDDDDDSRAVPAPITSTTLPPQDAPAIEEVREMAYGTGACNEPACPMVTGVSLDALGSRPVLVIDTDQDLGNKGIGYLTRGEIMCNGAIIELGWRGLVQVNDDGEAFSLGDSEVDPPKCPDMLELLENE